MQRGKSMAIADANIILRYILNDHEILSAKAAAIIENNRVNLPIKVACELVSVAVEKKLFPHQQLHPVLKRQCPA